MPEKSEQLPTHEKRFGYIAIEKRFITPQQLVEALDTQITEEIRDRKHRLISEILVDLKFITLEQVEEVLAVLTKT